MYISIRGYSDGENNEKVQSAQAIMQAWVDDGASAAPVPFPKMGIWQMTPMGENGSNGFWMLSLPDPKSVVAASEIRQVVIDLVEMTEQQRLSLLTDPFPFWNEQILLAVSLAEWLGDQFGLHIQLDVNMSTSSENAIRLERPFGPEASDDLKARLQMTDGMTNTVLGELLSQFEKAKITLRQEDIADVCSYFSPISKHHR